MKPQNIKRIISFAVCLIFILSAAACGKNNDKTQNPSIKDIPTAEAEAENPDENVPEEQENEPEEYSEAETEKYVNSETKSTDYRSERERVEIGNNLRDAEELIDNGDFEDAMMIIQSLKTRKLSDDESKRLNELQKRMISVSD